MKRFVVFGTSACALSLAVAVQLTAQQGKPADPRVGLKPGLRDAGKAAWHLELVASMQKPPCRRRAGRASGRRAGRQVCPAAR